MIHIKSASTVMASNNMFRIIAAALAWHACMVAGQSHLAAQVAAAEAAGGHAGGQRAAGSTAIPLTAERKQPLTEQSPVALRCAFTRGTWCKDFLTQQPVAWKPPPRGNKDCNSTKWGVCNNVGNCNHDTGYCECTAGWIGPTCETRQKRPCTIGHRHPDDKREEPIHHMDEHNRDRDWTVPGWSYSRCGGICDDDIAACYCDGPMGRIPAPPDAPPGTPPIRRGRPLVTHHMAPKTTWDGKKAFGDQRYEDVYGPQGYCNVTKPQWSAACNLDDLNGFACEAVTEAFCPNGCSGHGYCNLGYCKCDEGYYGHDCSRRRAGLPLLPSRIPTTTWLAASVKEPPAAMEPPPKPTRLRPLIYVYDLEPLYASRLLQYRISSTWCVHRRYDERNNTFFIDNWVYAADTLIHEGMLQSEHRTFDPEEADFFYVPHMASCYPFPIMNWADYPWFPTTGGPRVAQMAFILREVHKFIDTQYPFWKRRGGRDHIFLFTHDEGACWVPTVLNSSVWLTHWGRTELNHTCNTAFRGDRYDEEFKTWRQPEGWLHYTQGHPCYVPGKDLVVPSFKSHMHYRHSALAGAAAKARDIFLFFKGDVGKGRFPNYSRGVRQAIYQLAQPLRSDPETPVLVGDGREIPGDYSEHMARSKFCLVAPGDGWSARMEDAMMHGCIPVIIMDRVHAVFESILQVEDFSIRVHQVDIPRIFQILKAIPDRQVRQMQAHIGRVWHRFRYASGPALINALRQQLATNTEIANRNAQVEGGAGIPKPAGAAADAAAASGAGASGAAADAGSSSKHKVHLPRPFKGDPHVDDAFSTIIQWLYTRIPATR